MSAGTAFRVGDHVLVKTDNPEGHSRAPAFTRGRLGVVERYVGRFPHPAFLAMARPVVIEDDLFTVAFESVSLWGAQGISGDKVCVDLFASYLDHHDE